MERGASERRAAMLQLLRSARYRLRIRMSRQAGGWPKVQCMLGPIIRVLTIAVAVAIAFASPLGWFWRLAIFIGVVLVLDRLVIWLGNASAEAPRPSANISNRDDNSHFEE
jgi:hypothetical protein